MTVIPRPRDVAYKKANKKKIKNKKESEVASVTCTGQASASESSPAPRNSLGKRYVLPQFLDILVFKSLFLLFIKLHFCNPSSHNQYSNSCLSSFQFRSRVSLLTRQKVMKLTYQTPLLLSQRPPPSARRRGGLQRHHTVSICP